MPVRLDERQYRNMSIPLMAAEAKKLDTNYYVEGCAARWSPYVLWTGRDGTEYKEHILSTALLGADMSDVIMQYDHSGKVFARTSNKTLGLDVDGEGLNIYADLSKTAGSKDFYEDIAAGMITRMSWAFVIEDEEYDERTNTFVVRKIKKVYDVSGVSIPANDATTISARRKVEGITERLQADLLEDARKKIVLRIKLAQCANKGEKMNRIVQIDKRLADVEFELKDASGETLKILISEAESLVEERKSLMDEIEKRNAILGRIAAGEGKSARISVKPSPEFGAHKTDIESDATESMEYRRAFMNYIMRGTKIPIELRANTLTTDVSAAIPTAVVNRIVGRFETESPIISRVTKTALRGGVQYAKATIRPVANWVAEGTGSARQKVGVANISFMAYKLDCRVSVSLEVDTMTVPAFEAWLVNSVTTAMITALEQAIVNGDGIGKPRGIFTETPATAISVTAPSYDNIIAAEAALDDRYLDAVWIMSRKSFYSDFIGLKDTTGQPIARVNNGIDGKPAQMLLGREVVFTNAVPAFAAATNGRAFAGLFALADYAINTNYNMTIKQDEDFDTDDVLRKAVMLVDGKVIDAGSLVTLVKATA